MKTYAVLATLISLVWPGVAADSAATRERVSPNSTNAASTPIVQVYAGPRNLRFNFRGVPLETVLQYLSEAAGLVVVWEAPVQGTVVAFSEQPLNRAEAVELINSILNAKGYAALLRGRSLTIVSRQEAARRDLPVRSGAHPQAIPRNEERVTQIIPIRFAAAPQLVKDLQALLPSDAVLTANESGNALILTDTQAHIRRVAEIVTALDGCISAGSTLRVFPLRSADAKDLASVIKELFPSASASQGAGGNTGMGGGFPTLMGGGPGMDAGGPVTQAGGGSGGATGQSEARKNASQVTAVADERTNCLVVGAPEEALATVARIVESLDSQAENITAVRLFRLRHADPSEMADVLAGLFSDTSDSSSTRTATQFGGGPGGMAGGPGGSAGPGGASAGAATGSSLRAQKQGQVLSVADPRTRSLLVSAAKSLMPELERIVAELDANPARKQRVTVYTIQSGSANNVATVLQELFQSQTSSSSSQNNNLDALVTRQTQSIQTMSQSLSSSLLSSRTGGGSNSQ